MAELPLFGCIWMMSFFGVHSVLETGVWPNSVPVVIPRTDLAGVGILMVSGMI